MLSEKQIEAVEETAETLARRRRQAVNAGERARAKTAASPDYVWARKNLRWQAGAPLLDIANVLRVFERHEDFNTRFRYNETLNKVLDKGSVMVEWRMLEVCAVIQERFLPGVPEAIVRSALIVAGNRKNLEK